MAGVANSDRMIVIQVQNFDIPVGGMTCVAADAGGCVGVLCLPARQKNMPVSVLSFTKILKSLVLGHIPLIRNLSVALETMRVADWTCQRCRLDGGAAVPS